MIDRKCLSLPSLVLSILLASCGSRPASAVDDPKALTWQRDCAGQFEFDLPGKVDLPIPRWADVIGGHSYSYAFVPRSTYNPSNKFLGDRDQNYKADAHAWGSKQRIAGSSLFPGPDVSLEDFAQLQQGIETEQQNEKAELIAGFHAKDAEKIKLTPGATKDTFIWEYDSDREVFLWRGGRTFLYRVGSLAEQQINARVKHIAEDLRPRETFELPKEQGLCLQGGFLPEKDNPAHVIGVTYRLRAHPEVEIFFEAATAPTNIRSNGTVRPPADEVRLFWDGRFGADDKQHKLIHPHIPGVVQFPDVTISGYKGKSSFIEITRSDGSIDYGYMAFVMGEASGGNLGPTLMLYVTRTAKRVQGEPMSKDQVKDIAERIAESVKRRAISP